MNAHSSAATHPTRRVGFPGELGVPPTPISFEVPAGWSTAPVDRALAVIRDEHADPSGFHTNVVVSVDRVASSVTLSTAAADVLADARRSATRLVLADEQVLELAGAPAIMREQVIEVEAAATPLVQFVLLLVVEVGDGAARDCIQLTATATEARRDAVAEQMAALVDSFSLDG